MIDKNCMSYWWGILEKISVPVPKTILVTADFKPTLLLDGKTPVQWYAFIESLQKAGDALKYPCFLRSGQLSGKHEYIDTCKIEKPQDFAQHTFNIIEETALSSMIGGLWTNTWAVREFLDLAVPGFFKAFKGLIIGKERRYFIRDGKVQCHHPYWPEMAFVNSYYGDKLPDNWHDLLNVLNKESGTEIAYLTVLAEKIAAEFKGYWSVDFARVVGRGWVCIDMALGDDSFHWDGCPFLSDRDKRWHEENQWLDNISSDKSEVVILDKRHQVNVEDTNKPEE